MNKKTARVHAWICGASLLFLGGCFPKQPGRHLAHFNSLAPAVGEPAPLFALEDLQGNTVALAELIGEKPIVLQFGSHTCPVYRYRRFSMEGVWEDYADRVYFLLIYTQEAHPVGSKSPYTEGEWDTWWNRLTGVRVQQAEDEETRTAQARLSHEKLELAPTMVVDSMDNVTWETYGAASSPAFVVDLEGRIVARQPWVVPKELRQVLDGLLDKAPR